MKNNHDDFDQLVDLVQNTRRIAEALIASHQDEQVKDHKINLIGTSMINHREDLKELMDNNLHLYQEMSNQVAHSEQQRNDIHQLIDKSDNRFRILQKTHLMQQEFMASFDRLQEKHQTLVSTNNENHNEYCRSLDVLIQSVNYLQSRIKHMNVVEQTEQLTQETLKIHHQMQSYIENRRKFQAYFHNTTQHINEEILSFLQVIRNYQSDIIEIEDVVESCEKQVIMIDDKLDHFMKQYDIKMRKKLNTLDDTFEQPAKEKPSRGFFAKLFGGERNE